MTISMYKASVPIFVQFLTSLSAWLDKAAAHARSEENRSGRAFEHAPFSGCGTAFPPARQVRASTDHAINAVRTPRRRRAADFRQHVGSIVSRLGFEERVAKTIEFHQGDQAGADRWQRGQGDHDEICERRAQVLRAVAVAELLPAELLFSCHDRLRHPASEWRRARQAGLHGNAAPTLAAAMCHRPVPASGRVARMVRKRQVRIGI